MPCKSQVGVGSLELQSWLFNKMCEHRKTVIPFIPSFSLLSDSRASSAFSSPSLTENCLTLDVDLWLEGRSQTSCADHLGWFWSLDVIGCWSRWVCETIWLRYPTALLWCVHKTLALVCSFCDPKFGHVWSNRDNWVAGRQTPVFPELSYDVVRQQYLYTHT